MSTRDKKLLIVLAGVILIALSYFFVFQKQNEKRDEYEAENQQLEIQYNDLYEKAQRADEYNAEIDEMNANIEAKLSEYPSYLQIENVIMDVVNLEEAADTKISSLTVAEAVAVEMANESETTEETAADTAEASEDELDDADASEEGAATDADASDNSIKTSSMQLYNMESTLDFTSNTKGLKALIRGIVESKNKQSINSLTVAYDSSSGQITGNLLYDSFFLYGLDKPYEEPFIPSISHGKDDLFGTGSKKQNN